MTNAIQLPAVIQDGLIIAVTGYVIVFFALLLLYYLFSGLSRVFTWDVKQRLLRRGKLPKIEKDSDLHIPGEVTAAIAMSIYLCRYLHDDESNILTIKKVSKAYSPWSSKIYGLRNFNR